MKELRKTKKGKTKNKEGGERKMKRKAEEEKDRETGERKKIRKYKENRRMKRRKRGDKAHY